MKILDVGCGNNKYIGGKEDKVIGIDKINLPSVDVVHEIEKIPWPFKKNEFDMVICSHVLEHVENIIKVMKEIHRITKPGGIVIIKVPYFTSPGAFTDPTHRRFFTLDTFDYFDKNTILGKTLSYEVENINFKIEEKKLFFPRSFNILLIPLLVKISPRIYEEFFSRIFSAREIYFRLRVIK
ncbi:MAG: class I SAM-dependent methyltransferase [Candidatus Aenigmatarchaeota archaeon]